MRAGTACNGTDLLNLLFNEAMLLKKEQTMTAQFEYGKSLYDAEKYEEAFPALLAAAREGNAETGQG